MLPSFSIRSGSLRYRIASLFLSQNAPSLSASRDVPASAQVAGCECVPRCVECARRCVESPRETKPLHIPQHVTTVERRRDRICSPVGASMKNAARRFKSGYFTSAGVRDSAACSSISNCAASRVSWARPANDSNDTEAESGARLKLECNRTIQPHQFVGTRGDKDPRAVTRE